MKKVTVISTWVVVWIFASMGVGCTTTFNFTGVPAGGDDGLETIAIDLFGNQAPVVVPNLAQEFTQQLQDRFISQSRLALIASDADVNVSGSITQYRISPVAISGDERAAQNRLTIGVQVKYENMVTPEDSWDQSFSSFVDFDSDLDFISIEQEKISEIVEQLTQDIFNKSLGKW
ncbi:MAG: LptE family protein [Bacteroidota bacterium]